MNETLAATALLVTSMLLLSVSSMAEEGGTDMGAYTDPTMQPAGQPVNANFQPTVYVPITCPQTELSVCVKQCMAPSPDPDPVPDPVPIATSEPSAAIIEVPEPTRDPDALQGLDMGSLCRFAILTKSGVTQTSSAINPTVVTGDVGTSPIAYTALTGFAPVMSEKGTHFTSHIVKGNMYGANHAVPTPAMLTTAVLDMQAAHVDGMGRKFPDAIELGAGILEGYTLKPGLYKWATGIGWASKLTFEGGPDDVWILQVSGIITSASYSNVILQGGARAENIFWITTAAVFGTYSHLEGVFLASTAITFATGSSLNGAAFAQTAVTLDTANVLKETCGQSWSESDGGWKTEVAPLN